jgi:uncharacterized membrane protein
MTDTENTTPPPAPRETDKWLNPGPQNALVIYILYLIGFVIGITAIIGIVMAYLSRGKAGGFVESHYTWQIRTFWIALLGSFVSALLFIIGIGFLLMLAVAVWVIVRVIKGIMTLQKNEPIADPTSWWI